MFNPNITDKFKALIDKSRNIAVLSHFPPDHDSVSSTLLVQNYLISLYPDKTVDCITKISLDGQFLSFSFIDTSRFIPFENAEMANYDLIILVDVEDIERAIYVPKSDNATLSMLKSKTIVLDHHDCKVDTRHKLNICDTSFVSSTELVTVLFKETYRDLEISVESSQLAQLGIIADSNRFLYGCTTKVFELFTELSKIEQLDIEEMSQKINPLPQKALKILETLIHNMLYIENRVYTYYQEDVYSDEEITEKEIKEGCTMFLQHIARNLINVEMVTLLKPYRGYEKWRVMFRSKRDGRNVSLLSKSFKGGGHINAASCVIEEASPHSVIDIIEREIKGILP